MSDHVDGSGITFAPSLQQVGGLEQQQAVVHCINPDRNLGWGIWIARVDNLPAAAVPAALVPLATVPVANVTVPVATVPVVNLTDHCNTVFPLITVTGPMVLGVAGAPVNTLPQCQSEPMPQVLAGALEFTPVLRKVASFLPLMTPDLQGNMTATLGDYTVNCGAVQCWIVDEREVIQAAGAAVAGAVGAFFGSVVLIMGGWLLASIGSILCCVSCCIACVSDEPDERPTKAGRLMNEDSGDDV